MDLMEQSKRLKKIRKQVFLLGFFKIPMLWFVRPKVISINEKECVVKIRLRRRTKNHVRSMYFGAMAVGADLSAGLHTFYFAEKDQNRMHFVFKSMACEFLKRAESDVRFISREGSKIENAVKKARESGERQNQEVMVEGVDDQDEVVATFKMVVSVKFK
jgi:acyl-coenzyme A thioesterase PaaI-like protein